MPRPPSVPSLQDPHEKAVAKDLIAASSDESLCDMELISLDDNERIPAIRFVLAARSPVFRTMLYGFFRESKSDTISLDYSSATLKAIVHFCTTHELQPTPQDTPEHHVSQLVQIAQAADYLELPELKARTNLAVQSIISREPSLACVVLEETELQSSLSDAALVVIESRPYVALTKGISHLSPRKLERVLQSSALGAGEWFLFQLLSQWHEERQEDVNVTREVCARGIRFANIDPSLLLTLRACAWVSQEAIFDAVAKQAVRASQRHAWSLDFRGGAEKTDKVLVENAGSPDCNGMYYRIAPGLSQGSDLYSKREVACGQEYVYTLSRRVRSIQRSEPLREEPYYEMRIFRNSFLTFNAVKQLEAMQISSNIISSFQPVLQVLELNPPSLDAKDMSVPTPIRQFHRVRVSDGSMHMPGTLSAELSGWIEKGELDVNHVIQIHEFGMYRVHGCAGIHIIRAKVVTAAPIFRFGDPRPLPLLEEASSVAAPEPTGGHQNLYTCEYPMHSKDNSRVPQSMWQVDEGMEPTPECWFIPATVKEEGSSGLE